MFSATSSHLFYERRYLNIVHFPAIWEEGVVSSEAYRSSDMPSLPDVYLQSALRATSAARRKEAESAMNN